MTESTTQKQATGQTSLFQPVAAADDPSVKRYNRAGNGDETINKAVSDIAAAHPAVSPWFPLSEDEKKAKGELRKIRAAARNLERRVITGTHSKTGQPVWALGGPAKPRAASAAGSPEATAERTLVTDPAVEVDPEPVDGDATSGRHVRKRG